MRSFVYIALFVFAALHAVIAAEETTETKQPETKQPETNTLPSEQINTEEKLETQLERPFVDASAKPEPEATQETTEELDCLPHICHRMYRPICAIVDGNQVTAPSRCEFNNQVRCAARARNAGKAAPLIRFLHNGACRGESMS